MAEFSHIVFRDSPAGRQAYVQGTSLAVWEVIMVLRAYGDDRALTAEHLAWPLVRVQAAAQYAAAFPDEIEAAIEENDAYDELTLSRMLPQLPVFEARDDMPDSAATAPGGRDSWRCGCCWMNIFRLESPSNSLPGTGQLWWSHFKNGSGAPIFMQQIGRSSKQRAATD